MIFIYTIILGFMVSLVPVALILTVVLFND